MSPSKPTDSIWAALKGEDAGQAHRWLKWHPSEVEACAEARAEALAEPLEPEELEELRAFHRKAGASPPSLAALEQLGRPATRVVIAGQQPGLLAGPLYSVYKALGVVMLARSLAERRPDLNFVPVFWVASEDHDFNEVRRVFWPGSGGELVEMLIDHPEMSPGRMIGRLRCGELGAALLKRIEFSTHETEFRAALFESIREAYQPERTWEEAFCRLFLGLFAGEGLVLVSPLMRWVRRRARPIVEAEAREAGLASDLAIERGKELERAGLAAPLHRHPGAVNFFWIDENDCRHRLRLTAGAIEAIAPGEGGAAKPFAQSPEALAQRVAEAPEDFSLNVVTRPMAQDTIFSTVAHVVGPGEAAYLPQVEAVYDRFGVFKPVRFPRPQVLLVQNNVARALKKYGLTVEQAIASDATKLARWVLKREMDEGIVHEVTELRRRQSEQLAELESKIGTNSAVSSAFARLAQGMEKGYSMVIDRLLYSRNEDERHLNRAMRRIEIAFSPGGKPQERVLNPLVPFALTQGPLWLQSLREKITADPAEGLQVVGLSGPAVKSY